MINVFPVYYGMEWEPELLGAFHDVEAANNFAAAWNRGCRKGYHAFVGEPIEVFDGTTEAATRYSIKLRRREK